jgi:hypothetical protein
MVHHNAVRETGFFGKFGSAKTLLFKQNQDFCSSHKTAMYVSDFFQVSVRMHGFFDALSPVNYGYAVCIEKL